MFGADAVRQTDDGFSLSVGVARFDVVTRDRVHQTYGEAATIEDDRDEFMAALTIRTRSLDRAYGILREASGIRLANRIIVPSSATFGVIMEFCE